VDQKMQKKYVENSSLLCW